MKNTVISGMFTAHIEPEPVLVPSQALMFYTSKSNDRHDSSLLATSHPVHQYEGQPSPVIGAGHVLPDADLRELLLSMLDMTSEYTGIIPPDVLVFNSKKIAWVVKSSVRTLYFKPVGKEKSIKFTVVVPTLLFVATAKGFSIAALKEIKRPTKDTPLYHAPLMNIYDDGRVCLGSATMPSPLSLTVRDKIEACIFDTNFSHINHPNTIAGKKSISNTAHLAFWRNLNKEQPKTFPKSSLVPMGVTVGGFL